MVLGVSLLLAARATAEATLAGLSPPDQCVRFHASGVSGDGSTVVGQRSYAVIAPPCCIWLYEAFRWRPGIGFLDLGFLPGDQSSFGSATSGDGAVVVGRGSQGYRWTETGGMVGVGLNSAVAVSADGSTLVGSRLAGSSSFEAALWTEDSGVVGLGVLPGGALASSATGVSADGSIVVGYSDSSSGHQAFLWTAADGMVGLGSLLAGGESSAQAISADGSTVVGWSDTVLGARGFVWDADTGMKQIAGPSIFSPIAVSGDGSLVVGGTDDANFGAFILQRVEGAQSVQRVLEKNFGVDVAGWSLTSATGISEDGRVIVGVGSSPNCGEDGWIATIDPGCGDGVDNDGDDLIDYPNDPGCRSVSSFGENPECDDDLDNDGDGKVDWDGGTAGGVPDPTCNAAWKDREKLPKRCGLGFEILLLMMPAMWLHRRRLSQRGSFS
jgi:probable HAF family extracellular repeat protein